LFDVSETTRTHSSLIMIFFFRGKNCNWQFFDSENFKELIPAVQKIKKPYNSDTNLPQSNEILLNLGMQC
jgi:hypothetical protein